SSFAFCGNPSHPVTGAARHLKSRGFPGYRACRPLGNPITYRSPTAVAWSTDWSMARRGLPGYRSDLDSFCFYTGCPASLTLDSSTSKGIIEGLFSPQECTAMFTPRTRLPIVLVSCCTLVLGLWLGTVGAKRQAPQRPPLSPEQRDAFLAGRRNAVLATIKKDGSPQLTPVWYRWDGEQFWVSTTKQRAKSKDIVRVPAVNLG